MNINIEILATVLFALAVFHTFSVKQFQHLALRFKEGSVAENAFHFLGEVEIVFGLWAGILAVLMGVFLGKEKTIAYLEGLNFNEPIFVFVIMVMSATRPVLFIAEKGIELLSFLVPLRGPKKSYFAILTVGPLLGSFITEPAAMTVTALLLRDKFFSRTNLKDNFKYLTLATLFVNVSIGGVLTPFAAPPVLMVASVWKWNFSHMLLNFGWKAVVAVIINTIIATYFFPKSFRENATKQKEKKLPWGICFLHCLFILGVVLSSHHCVLFFPIFLFFLGMVAITQEYQEELKLKESLLVAFFLAGLVVLGGLQSWWLEPLLFRMNALQLYLSSTALTAVVDNAALTYLGAQVPHITDAMKYSLVAGAVVGGGLTVIANAPNPAGFSILRSEFGKEGISPLKLFSFALLPTIVALFSFWW